MKFINQPQEMSALTAQLKTEQKSIAFVPTMGFLHEGHLSLIKAAQSKYDVVVVSIFVNPRQFGENEDFDNYPRDLERDLKLAEEHGAHIMFHPSQSQMYPAPMRTEVNVIKGNDVLCAKSRPGHFNGVATVVMKLFQLVKPDAAFFGMKDAQQVAILKNMVHDFNMNVDIETVETSREEDGLAKSSRNVNLNKTERQEAASLYKALKKGKELIQMGKERETLLLEVENELIASTSAEIDYIDLLTFPELEVPQQLTGQLILAGAIRFQQVRLIDNITFEL
ncbi:pantoate--beta-alanine ligase [Salsuginibacillus kocurii]|uniref:pantoate--beta-alanine ligase n=1 Tax=Salsuginibacillus kocurii TaxID=427078 RepID=UPI00037FE1F7|nr:pantoate--beta-alanine ligase [Salsuginibacillus kocurii]